MGFPGKKDRLGRIKRTSDSGLRGKGGFIPSVVIFTADDVRAGRVPLKDGEYGSLLCIHRYPDGNRLDYMYTPKTWAGRPTFSPAMLRDRASAEDFAALMEQRGLVLKSDKWATLRLSTNPEARAMAAAAAKLGPSDTELAAD